MMQQVYMISAAIENQARVLQRMTGIFARFRVSIEQLIMSESNIQGRSLFKIIILSDEKSVERIMHQLRRIIELLEVNVKTMSTIVEERK